MALPPGARRKRILADDPKTVREREAACSSDRRGKTVVCKPDR